MIEDLVDIFTSDLCNMHLRSYDAIKGHEQFFSNNFLLDWASASNYL